MQEFTENFCNLVTNNCQDKENNRAIITVLCQEMSKMKALIAALQHMPQPTPQTPFPKCQTPIDAGGYCWTHGYLVAVHHTNKTCCSKKWDTTTKQQNNLGGRQVGNPKHDR
jgi:hypothetical protein